MVNNDLSCDEVKKFIANILQHIFTIKIESVVGVTHRSNYTKNVTAETISHQTSRTGNKSHACTGGTTSHQTSHTFDLDTQELCGGEKELTPTDQTNFTSCSAEKY